MATKARAQILDRYGDDNGDLLRIGRKGSRYFIEKIDEAYSPYPGRVTRTYMKKSEAVDTFDRFCEEA